MLIVNHASNLDCQRFEEDMFKQIMHSSQPIISWQTLQKILFVHWKSLPQFQDPLRIDIHSVESINHALFSIVIIYIIEFIG